MNIDHRNPRLRRGFAFVALAALLGLSVVGLSQCRLVDDTVTGTDVQANSGVNARSDCVHRCNNQYKACRRGQAASDKAALRACGQDKACKKAVKRASKGNHLACVRAMQFCKRNCYNEGAGIGGR